MIRATFLNSLSEMRTESFPVFFISYVYFKKLPV